MEKLPHKIQLAILARLREQSPARYGYLKPTRVEGNVFVYHLRALIKEGIVKKVPEGYALTAEGKQYVDTLREDGLGIRIQPKIVTLIALKGTKGAYLLYRRQQEPYRGLIGFPYGKVHLGEKIAESAERECHDKLGVVVPLVHAGEVYVGVGSGESLIHTLFHVFTVKIEGQPILDKEELFWEVPDTVPPAASIPGFHEIAPLIEAWHKKGVPQERFFAEFWLKE